MQRNLEIYNPTKTYYSPVNEIFTPEHVMSHYAIVNAGTCVIETNSTGKMFYAVELMEVARDRMNIANTLTDEEALVVMKEILNAPQPIPEPSPEERMASAMEFQNLLAL
jgi:hypothetical protein